MNLKLIAILLTSLLLSVNRGFSQIVRSLYVNTPCVMTMVPEADRNAVKNDITIFPNPNSGSFYIEFTTKLQPVEIVITIINELGYAVLTERPVILNNKININLSGFKPGIYLIRLSTGKEILLKKFIISH